MCNVFYTAYVLAFASPSLYSVFYTACMLALCNIWCQFCIHCIPQSTIDEPVLGQPPPDRNRNLRRRMPTTWNDNTTKNKTGFSVRYM